MEAAGMGCADEGRNDMTHIRPTLADAVHLVRSLRESNPDQRVAVVCKRGRWIVKEMK